MAADSRTATAIVPPPWLRTDAGAASQTARIDGVDLDAVRQSLAAL